MEKKQFSGSNLEECLEQASKELNIMKEKLCYEIIEEKKSLFKKRVVISVELPEVQEEKVENEHPGEGKVKIVDSNIYVTNPEEGSEPAYISPTAHIKLLVDGEEVIYKRDVYAESKIEVVFEDSIPSRKLDIQISEDKMEVFATLKYEPQKIYALQDTPEQHNIILYPIIVKEILPPKYTQQEIREELTKCGIIYGIIENNLKRCTEELEVNALVLAKGQAGTDGKDDRIEYKFEMDDSLKRLEEDRLGNVDFKSIGSVKAVNKGDVIAIKHPGEEGTDSIDVYGKTNKHKARKIINLKSGDGCTVSEQNKVITLFEGKPCVKNGVFYVYKVHEVYGDVDLKTGDVTFIGDVVIQGTIREGMRVIAGNSVLIHGDVERAQIAAKGDVTVKGSTITSKITAGGEDVVVLSEIDHLHSLREQLQKLVEAIEEIKHFNLLGYDISDGQIVKVLLETKFKEIGKILMNIITDIAKKKEEKENVEKIIITLIKEKLIGIAPLSIRHYSELLDFLEVLDKAEKQLKENLALPVNIHIGYCQDSTIQSSGDVVISGKGTIVSDIAAYNSVRYIDEGAVARGGIIKAKKEIRMKTVGSSGGVITKLAVDRDGQIWADVAYENTVFAIGEREIMLEAASKGIHAYVNSDHEVIIDKLKL